MKNRNMICISCPLGCALNVNVDGESIEVTGNRCKRGDKYAHDEIRDPKRIVTTTMKVISGSKPLVSVKTDKEIPKGLMLEVVRVINSRPITAPIKIGEVLINNILNTGTNIVATSRVESMN